MITFLPYLWMQSHLIFHLPKQFSIFWCILLWWMHCSSASFAGVGIGAISQCCSGYAESPRSEQLPYCPILEILGESTGVPHEGIMCCLLAFGDKVDEFELMISDPLYINCMVHFATNETVFILGRSFYCNQAAINTTNDVRYSLTPFIEILFLDFLLAIVFMRKLEQMCLPHQCSRYM